MPRKGEKMSKAQKKKISKSNKGKPGAKGPRGAYKKRKVKFISVNPDDFKKLNWKVSFLIKAL